MRILRESSSASGGASLPALDLDRLRAGTMVLGVVLLALATYLLIPRPAPREELLAAVRVVVVDASASVARTRPGWLRWVRGVLDEEARAAAERGDDVAVVVFASAVGVAWPPGEPDALRDALAGRGTTPFDPRAAAGRDDGSALAGAIETASAFLDDPARERGTLVLVGADAWTGDDPSPALASLRRAGVGFEYRDAPARELPDVSVVEVRLPPTVEANAPLLGTVRLRYVPGAEGARADVARAVELYVSVANAGATRVLRLDAELPPRGGTFDVPVECGVAGFGRTEVSARVVSGAELGIDPVPENDVASGAVHATGELVVLVGADARRLQAARDWLAPSGVSTLGGIQFVFAERAGVPALLADVDALVTFDLPTDALPEVALEDFLRRGGGWLATAGARFLDDWIPGVAAEGPARFLPLAPEPEKDGPRDVVLLVDGSGSMSGEPFDIVRAACRDLVAASLPSDEVALRFFTVRLLQPHVVKPRATGGAQDREEIEEAARRLLALHVPDGTTHILSSLEEFVAERRAAPRHALAFLLTDGLEREDFAGRAERAAALRDAAHDARIALRPIAIGEKADLEYLGLIAGAREEVATPDGLDELRDVFRREVIGARCRDGDLALHWSVLGADSIAGDLRGASDDALPNVRRIVKNVARDGAEVVWRADEDEPVLALWRVGLGRVAQLSTVPDDRWAPAWSRRLGYGEPARFGNLLRWLARGPDRDRGELDVEVRGDALVLSGLDATWPPLVRGRLDAALGRKGEGLEVELVAGGAGVGGGPGGRPTGTPAAAATDELFTRRTATLPHAVREAGAGEEWVLTVTDPSGAPVVLHVRPGPSPEFAGGIPLDAAVWERAPEAVRADEERAAPGASRGRPEGVWTLLAGLVALFAASVRRG